ncbi:MAG: NUDIX hydrolase [Bacillota bacterium]
MQPRAVSLGVVFRDECILVQELSGRHLKGTGTHYRPIGGTIEYGERSSETVVREFEEETGMAVEIVRYLGCIENVFTIDGQTGHDIDFVYAVSPIDESQCSEGCLRVTEGDNVGIAKWVPIEAFRTGKLALYPDGLIDLLMSADR